MSSKTIVWLLLTWSLLAAGLSLYHQHAARNPQGTISIRTQSSAKDAQGPFSSTFPGKTEPITIPSESTPSPNDPAAIPGERVLRFHSAEDLTQFLQAARSRGITLLGTLNAMNAVRIRVDDPKAFEKLMDHLPKPDESTPNFLVRIPNPPGSTPATSSASYAGFGNSTLDWLGVPKNNQAWGKDVTVAVLDTGIQSHAAFPGKNIPVVSLLENSSPNGDYQGHGTAVASLIAGNLEDARGMAPGSSLLSIQVLGNDGSGDTFSVAQGIMEAVQRGARVINLSLGSEGDSPILRQAVEYALQNGVALVAAAGNESLNHLSYPARYPGVIAVGAIDAREQHLDFSNSGPEIMLSAPGYGVFSAWSGNQWANFTGTSAAAPLVSGAMAALMSQTPSLTPHEAASILTRYSDDAGAPGFDNQYGHGIINMQRVLERNQPGIMDIAIASHYLQPNPSDTQQPMLTVSTQNRGTTRLQTVQMNVSIDGQSQTLYFHDLNPGQTASQAFSLNFPYIQASGGIRITSTVSIPSTTDIRPRNNTSTSLIHPSIPSP